jgi:hypothetical protein
MCVKYILIKCVTINFGFFFYVWALHFDFHKLMLYIIILKKINLND